MKCKTIVFLSILVIAFACSKTEKNFDLLAA
jgi:hypothetical protein